MNRAPRSVGRIGRVMRSSPAIALVAAVAVAPMACQPTLEQAEGLVLRVDSPTLGRVDGFVLLTPGGQQLEFDTSDLGFQPDFPAAHLSEHQVMASSIRVTYRQEGERLMVTQLDDA